jgi:hypothetical protein
MHRCEVPSGLARRLPANGPRRPGRHRLNGSLASHSGSGGIGCHAEPQRCWTSLPSRFEKCVATMCVASLSCLRW